MSSSNSEGAPQDSTFLFGASAQSIIRNGLITTPNPMQFVEDFQQLHFLRPEVGLFPLPSLFPHNHQHKNCNNHKHTSQA